MVRLRLMTMTLECWILLAFNPTMVRLRRNKILLALCLTQSFNPTMVRLRLRRLSDGTLGGWQVSIPLWCDCDCVG